MRAVSRCRKIETPNPFHVSEPARHVAPQRVRDQRYARVWQLRNYERGCEGVVVDADVGNGDPRNSTTGDAVGRSLEPKERVAKLVDATAGT